MRPSISKKLFLVELLVLLLPSSVLFLYGAFYALIGAAGGSYSFAGTITTLVIVSLSLFSIWYLGLYFLRKGSENLINQNSFIWGFLIIGCIYSVIGLFFLAAIYFNQTAMAAILQIFRFGTFGIFLLIPAIHLYLEAQRNSS